RQNPRQRDWLDILRNAHRQRAYLRLQLDDRAGYEKDLQEADQLAERLTAPIVRLHRIGDRLQEGKLEAALREADELFQSEGLAPPEWYELARHCARAAAAAPDGQKDRLAGRAAQALEKAVEGGYESPMSIAEDEAFRPLAGREDFRKVVAGKKR